MDKEKLTREEIARVLRDCDEIHDSNGPRYGLLQELCDLALSALSPAAPEQMPEEPMRWRWSAKGMNLDEHPAYFHYVRVEDYDALRSYATRSRKEGMEEAARICEEVVLDCIDTQQHHSHLWAQAACAQAIRQRSEHE